MGKLLLGLSSSSLIFLGIGTSKTPGDAMFWLASGSTIYQTVRIVMIAFLLAQLFTMPPRQLWFRILSAVVAVTVATWTIQATIAFIMPALDTFAFLGSSILLLVTALEQKLTLKGLNNNRIKTASN